MSKTGEKLSFEKKVWRDQPGCVLAGVDEAGRGCLAGPVHAGAVTMSPERAAELYAGELAGLTDSKQLTARQRDAFYEILLSAPGVSFSVGVCTAAEIDRLNILAATHLAMRRALEGLAVSATFALVDGLPVNGLPCPSQAIVQGDAKSFLIAAASVVAKVSRDRYMESIDSDYPGYGFAVHKGYGTHDHMDSLFRLGSCAEHRHTFRPVRDVDESLPGLPLFENGTERA